MDRLETTGPHIKPMPKIISTLLIHERKRINKTINHVKTYNITMDSKDIIQYICLAFHMYFQLGLNCEAFGINRFKEKILNTRCLIVRNTLTNNYSANQYFKSTKEFQSLFLSRLKGNSVSLVKLIISSCFFF